MRGVVLSMTLGLADDVNVDAKAGQGECDDDAGDGNIIDTVAGGRSMSTPGLANASLIMLN